MQTRSGIRRTASA